MPPDDLRTFDPSNPYPEQWPPLDASLFEVSEHASAPFPLEALPRPVAEWVRRAASNVVDPAMVGLPLIVYAAAAIGNAREVATPTGQREALVLWGALVGASGTRKSGALRMLAPAVNAIARGIEARALNVWPLPESQVDRDGNPLPVVGGPCWLVGSITGERLAVDAWHNGRGLVAYSDELATILENLDRYSGSDRSLFLSGYDAARHSYRRRGNNLACTVERNSLAMVGGIQPERVATILMDGPSDGLASRFIYAYPRPIAWTRDTGSDEPPDAAVVELWLRRLLAIPPGGLEGLPETAPLALTDGAWAMYADWREADEVEVISLPENRWREWRAKAGGRVLRIAAVLAMLAWASERHDTEPPDAIDAESMSGALAIERWAAAHALAVHGAAALPRVEADARYVAAYLRAHRVRRYNFNDHRSGDAALRVILRDRRRRDEMHERMIDGGVIRFNGNRVAGVGRMSSDYDVSPKVWQAG